MKNHLTLNSLLSAVLLFFISQVELKALPRACRMKFCKTVPLIDGKLNDKCWQTVSPEADFIYYRGKKEGSKAKEQSEFKVAYDKDNLYLAIVCHESRMKNISAVKTSRDSNVYEDDCVEIFLLPIDEINYFHIIINSLGTVYDTRKDVGASYDLPIVIAVKRYEYKWIIELKISLKSLERAKNGNIAFRANICRERYAGGAGLELSQWTRTYTGFHQPEHFGFFISSTFRDYLKQKIFPELLTQKQRLNAIKNKSQVLIKKNKAIDLYISKLGKKIFKSDFTGKEFASIHKACVRLIIETSRLLDQYEIDLYLK